MPGFIDMQGLEIVFKSGQGVIRAVNNISYRLNQGQTHGAVGVSGAFTARMVFIKDDRALLQTVSYAAQSLFLKAPELSMMYPQ